MAKSTSLFPHFIRIFSAGVLWAGLSVLISVNVYARAAITPEVFPSMVAAMISPQSPLPHARLAQKLWSLGFLTAAKRELTIEEALQSRLLGMALPVRDVLGITSVSDLRSQWENEPIVLRENYQFWQSVVRDRPDYQAALVYTAGLAYQLSKMDEGESYIAQASRLDPNNAIANKLAALFR